MIESVRRNFARSLPGRLFAPQTDIPNNTYDETKDVSGFVLQKRFSKLSLFISYYDINTLSGLFMSSTELLAKHATSIS